MTTRLSPRDTAGEMEGGSEGKPPTKDTVVKAAAHPVFDDHGKQLPFSSLYEAGNGECKRTMIIFIRHFFCGVCQDYLRELAAGIPSTSLPNDLNIAIVGCGAPSLILSYTEQLGSFPYPIYADPSKELYNVFGMQYNLALGSTTPAYLHKSQFRVVLDSAVQMVRRTWQGDAFAGGPYALNGGEFLFAVQGRDASENKQGQEEVVVTWCHRMRNTQDHTEVTTLRKVLGLDAQ